MKSIKNIIKELVFKETSANVKIDDSNFLVVVLNKKYRNNFLLFATTVIICITFIISSFVFFLNDVLLFRNDFQTNEDGAIIPHKSCKREVVLFLLNSAEHWASTGISLSEGDKIKISCSGAFHSDIVGIKEAAYFNYKPKYNWISFPEKIPTEDTIKKLLVYNNKKDANFGSMLYALGTEKDIVNLNTIRQIDKNEAIEVKGNGGILYLSVNDIFLTDSVIRYYRLVNNKIFSGKNIITKAEYESKKDLIDLFWTINDSTYLINGDAFEDSVKTNRLVFYNDNLGEILVSINIIRNNNNLHLQSNWYRWTEDKIYAVWNGDHNKIISILLTIVVFIWSIFTLIWHILLFLWEIWYIVFFVLLFWASSKYVKKVFGFFRKKY